MIFGAIVAILFFYTLDTTKGWNPYGWWLLATFALSIVGGLIGLFLYGYVSKKQNGESIWSPWVLRIIGSFLILTSLPLCLYLYALYGVAYSVPLFFVYCFSGFFLRLRAYSKTVDTNGKTIIREAIKGTIFFSMAISIFIFVMILVKHFVGI